MDKRLYVMFEYLLKEAGTQELNRSKYACLHMPINSETNF